MKTINMFEVPGTSVAAKQTQFTVLLAKKTAPVFEAEPAGRDLRISQVVAVTYRNAAGKPVHGGIFGLANDEVMALVLKDLEGKVDTSRDPSWSAFGLVMMRGPLVFRQAGIDEEIPLSIVDLTEGRLNADLPGASAAREAVKAAYLAEVLPQIAEEDLQPA